MARKSSGEAERRAVEVAGRFDPPVERTTGLSTALASSRPATVRAKLEGVAGRAGDLGCTAHRVRVLHRVRQSSRCGSNDGRVCEQPVHVRGRGRLPRVRADGVQLRPERPVRAEHRLDDQGRGDVGHGEQVAQVVDRQQQHAEHAVGAVDQRQPLLRGELDRCRARPAQRVGGGQPLAVRAEHPALAEQRQRAVGQRCEVAGAAQRAVLAAPTA